MPRSPILAAHISAPIFWSSAISVLPPPRDSTHRRLATAQVFAREREILAASIAPAHLPSDGGNDDGTNRNHDRGCNGRAKVRHLRASLGNHKYRFVFRARSNDQTGIGMPWSLNLDSDLSRDFSNIVRAFLVLLSAREML